MRIARWGSELEQGTLGIDCTRIVETDENGRFAFSRVAPGEAWLSCYHEEPGLLGPGKVIGFSRTQRIDVPPGQVTQANLGGQGRPVQGRVAVAGADMPLRLWGSLVLQERSSAAESQFPAIRSAPGDYILDAARGDFLVSAADGSFRMDDLPAGSYRLYLHAYVRVSGSDGIEQAVAVTKDFVVPVMPQGRSEEVLDLGTVQATLRKLLRVGRPAPPLEARRSDGSRITLSDYVGKYLLLHLWPGPGDAGPAQQPSLGPVLDKFGGDDALALVTLVEANASNSLPPSGKRAGAHPVQFIVADRSNLPEEYRNAQGAICLIGPDGRILGKSHRIERTLYAALDRAQQPKSSGFGDAKVVAEHNSASAASPAFKFTTVPPISKDDAGQGASFTIIDGEKAPYGGGLGVLNDGQGPRTADDESLMLAFQTSTLEGRIQADLEKVVSVGQINTYSWYKNGNRWPQVFRVYGSDGASPDFDPQPKNGVDPATCGWTPIASVDTRSTPGGTDLRDGMIGQDGVSIRGGAAGSLGRYRYLLFLAFATETHDMWGQTFWSEIDIVAQR